MLADPWVKRPVEGYRARRRQSWHFSLLCSFKAPNGRGWVAWGATMMWEGRELNQLCSSAVLDDEGPGAEDPDHQKSPGK